jgi:hypothetical protein
MSQQVTVSKSSREPLRKKEVISFDGWDDSLENCKSFSEKIQQLYMLSYDISHKSKVKKFINGNHREEARKILIKHLIGLEKNICLYKPEMDGIEACGLLETYGRLQVRPSRDAAQFLLLKIGDALPTFNANHLGNIPGLFSDLAMYPGDAWMDNWCRKAISKSGDWSIRQGFAVIHKLAILDHLRPDNNQQDSPSRIMAMNMLRTVEKMAGHFFTGEVDSQIYLAAHHFGLDFVRDHKIESEDNTVSKIEGKLSDHFRKAGILSDTDIIVDRIDHKIDLPCIFNKVVIASELDGVYHFLWNHADNKMVFDGSTRFNSSIIRSLMPDDMQLLRIPFFVAKGIKHSDEWHEPMEILSREDAGVYVLHDMDDVRPAHNSSAWEIKMRRQP